MNELYPSKTALSIRQPWAWLIVNGYKNVENRSWSTWFRGVFLIHASKRFDNKAYDWVSSHFSKIELPMSDEFEIGGIVGSAELVDCVTSFDSLWFEGPYGFVLENARPLPFHPMPGRLGFFQVSI